MSEQGDEPMGPFELPLEQVAKLDQAEAGFTAFARGLAAYYRALVRAGFSEEDAFELTIDYQRTILLRTAPE